MSLLLGCGRINFGVPGVPGDTDVAPCRAGDNICRVSCLSTDPDCVAICGDGQCVGNAGELCTNCTDCDTMSSVCGNGACDPTEDSDTCFADCGPIPWTWEVEELDLLSQINTARTSGTTCPGGGGPITSAAIIIDPTLRAAAREWAWEYAYQQFTGSGSCNGRSENERFVASGVQGAASFWVANGGDTPTVLMMNFLNNMAICNDILNAAYTKVGIGVVFQSFNSYVLIFD